MVGSMGKDGREGIRDRFDQNTFYACMKLKIVF